MPLKIVKGKQIIMGQKEYESIKKNGEFYILTIDTSHETFSDKQKLEFCQMNLEKKSKDTICKYFDISDTSFSTALKRWFNMTKISDVRDMLRDENTKKSLQSTAAIPEVKKVEQKK